MADQSKAFSVALALALLSMACGMPGPGGAQTPVDAPADAPADAVDAPAHPPVVGYNFFRPGTEAELKAAHGGGPNEGRPIANYGYMIAKAAPGFDPAALAKHGVEVVGSVPANGARYYRLHKGSDLVETMKKVGGMGGVLYVEPEIMYYTTAGLAGLDYDNPDPLVAGQQQYGVLTTHTREAWETFGFGANRPVVAAIDTGVSYNHPELASVVSNAFSWFDSGGVNPLPGGGPLADPDPVDWRVTRPSGSTDGHGHGTHTAGTIAAQGNNGAGVAGVCWGVDLVSYKAVNDRGEGSDWTVFGSLWHLARRKGASRPGAIPVNMSLGTIYAGHFAADMLEAALEHGIVPVCAAGNDSSGFATWPGSYTGAIRVGAVNYLDRRAGDSNWGQDLCVMAPGRDVVSTVPGGYEAWSGTSMAAPHVAGLAGYMLTFAPDLRADQIRTYIERNADPIDGQKGFDPRFGHGRINTCRTIRAVLDDIENGRAPGSDYAPGPVKVTVLSASGRPFNGAAVYLYNSGPDGSVTNYAGVALTGGSFVGAMDGPAGGAEDGVAWFNMLKPGHYKVAASYSVQDLSGADLSGGAESAVFEVGRAPAAAPVTLSLGIDPQRALYIQTYPCAGTDPGLWIDTQIAVYDAGGLLADFDDGGLDTLGPFVLSRPGTYWINIYPWGDEWGDYALWLGEGLQPSPAPGSFASPGPDGIRSSQAQTQAGAQPIQIGDRVVYCRMSSRGGDWYRFAAP